jgi:FkbM family methyltransferase
MRFWKGLRGGIFRIRRGLNKYAVRSTPLWLLGGTSAPISTKAFGSDDGQWDVPADLVDKNWICYAVGIGHDASFDADLASRVGCNVFSFDPTPAAVTYVESLGPVGFRFLPWAIWENDGHLDFFSQDIDNNVNLSAIDSGRGQLLYRARCYRLKSVMKQLEHSQVDLLKLDIEGGWLPVIKDIVASKIPLRVFCVEFDSPTSILRVRQAVRLLSDIGLRLVHRRRDNYLFVEQSALPSAPQ